jgi:thiamine biosynthesis lipoprotein
MPLITRRRMIEVTAAAGGLGLLPVGRRVEADAPLVTWRGVAFGAVASLRIHHPDRTAAERLVRLSVAELRRLEGLFSLYRADSSLVQLNRRGVLEAPPAELVQVLGEAKRYAALTEGAFDPTVQPLWSLYANHFSRRDADPAGPSPEALTATLDRVSHRHLLVSRDRIAFARRGVALTLNGIAPGYVTDRIVDLLRSEGIDRTLVDMGESRGIGTRPDGRPWQVAIADPDEPDRLHNTLTIADQAVATSGGYGYRFDPQGRFNHLFDPRTGLSAQQYRSVTVVLPTAAAADALSTAFSHMPLGAIGKTLKMLGTGRTHVLTAARERVMLAA